MKIAVTGASGHIGNVVCRLLLEQGHEVHALFHSDKTAISDLNIYLVQGDMLRRKDLETLVSGCNIVINCAAVISIEGDPTGMVFKTNTEGPKLLLDVCLQYNIKKLIHISSVHAVVEIPHETTFDEQRPYKQAHDFVYDYSKATAEQYLLNHLNQSITEISIIRPSAVVGPFDFKPSKMGSALIDLYNNKIPCLPEGGYDIVDVRDVANTIITAMTAAKHGEIYLTAGKYVSFKQLCNSIQHVTGKTMPKLILPYWFLKLLLPLIALYSRIVHKPAFLTKEAIVAVKFGHPNMDSSKAHKHLGHTYRPLENTLTDFFNWQKEKQIIT